MHVRDQNCSPRTRVRLVHQLARNQCGGSWPLAGAIQERFRVLAHDPLPPCKEGILPAGSVPTHARALDWLVHAAHPCPCLTALSTITLLQANVR